MLFVSIRKPFAHCFSKLQFQKISQIISLLLMFLIATGSPDGGGGAEPIFGVSDGFGGMGGGGGGLSPSVPIRSLSESLVVMELTDLKDPNAATSPTPPKGRGGG